MLGVKKICGDFAIKYWSHSHPNSRWEKHACCFFFRTRLQTMKMTFLLNCIIHGHMGMTYVGTRMNICICTYMNVCMPTLREVFLRIFDDKIHNYLALSYILTCDGDTKNKNHLLSCESGHRVQRTSP